MAAYKNPAAAIGACKRVGAKTSRALYACALRYLPTRNVAKWRREVERLATKHGQLAGAKRPRRRRRK